MIRVRNNGFSDQGRGSDAAQFGCILKEEATRFAAGLDVE